MFLTVIIGVALLFDKSRKPLMLKWIKTLVPFFLMNALICFWFAFGDGDVANHRYALISYIMWTVFSAGVFSIFTTVETEEILDIV